MTGDNCPHVPVDMLMWRVFGRGRDWDVGGVAEVDHDERPEWDMHDWTGGDCEMRDTAGGGWMLSASGPIDRTKWPDEGSRWQRGCVTGEVEWSPGSLRWRMWDVDYATTICSWTAGPIDLTVWRPL
jgi:hypothetical protein